MKRLEELYNVADNYAWLSYRLPKFDERDKAFVVKNQVHALISALLDAMSEAQGEASWSRVERMRREAMLQRDAQAMRNLDRESRRSQKRSALESIAAVAAEEAEANAFVVKERLMSNATLEPTEAQLAIARSQVDVKALAQPAQTQTHAHAHAHAQDGFTEKIKRIQEGLQNSQGRREDRPPRASNPWNKPIQQQSSSPQSYPQQPHRKQGQFTQSKPQYKPQSSQFKFNNNSKQENYGRPKRRPARDEK